MFTFMSTRSLHLSQPGGVRRRERVGLAATLLVTAVVLIAAACAGTTPVGEGASVERAYAEAVDPAGAAAPEAAADVSAEDDSSPSNHGDTDEQEPTADLAAAAHDAETPTGDVQLVSYDGSFSSSIQPILEEKCASCHYDGGPGAFHWNLRTAQDVVDTHLLVQNVITTNAMPPWPAGGDSIAFAGDRSLRADQIDAIVDWVADGAPIDVEQSAAIEPVQSAVGFDDPDVVARPLAPYAGDPGSRDDLRCLTYDLDLDDGGWLTGYEFLPDQTAVVHHAVGFLMPAEARAGVDARDGQDGQPGWPCAGMVGLSAGVPVVLWTPGQSPTILPEGKGRRVNPGGFMVMQMHYHYDGDAPLDNSSVALAVEPLTADLEPVSAWYMSAPVEIPCAAWEDGPLCDRDAALANAVERFGNDGVLADYVNGICGASSADFEHFTDGFAQSSCTHPAPIAPVQGSVVVESVLLHMHQLGDWTRLTLNKGRPDELVVVDIPEWQYDWQYSYIPAAPLVVEVGDTITLECGWDRSLGTADVEPAWILWAEGTNDEMCVTVLSVY